VLLGNLLVDDIVRADGTTLMAEPGGALLHAALAACLWGVRPGLVSVAGADYPAAALEALAERGVDLAGVRRLAGPGGRAWLLHEPRARRIIHHLDGPTHAAVSPTLADLPDGFRSARAFHLAPMPLSHQLTLARGLAPLAAAHDALVTLDPFELVRDETLGDWRPLLAAIDGLFLGADEVRLAGAAEPQLRDVAGPRLRWLVLKAGAAGGRLVDLPGGSVHAWGARAERVEDVTGAGDAFAGGFLAGWIAHADLARALAQGVVAASFAVEDWGARGLVAATPRRARARLDAWFPHVAAADCGAGAVP